MFAPALCSPLLAVGISSRLSLLGGSSRSPVVVAAVFERWGGERERFRFRFPCNIRWMSLDGIVPHSTYGRLTLVTIELQWKKDETTQLVKRSGWLLERGNETSSTHMYVGYSHENEIKMARFLKSVCRLKIVTSSDRENLLLFSIFPCNFLFAFFSFFYLRFFKKPRFQYVSHDDSDSHTRPFF